MSNLRSVSHAWSARDGDIPDDETAARRVASNAPGANRAAGSRTGVVGGAPDCRWAGRGAPSGRNSSRSEARQRDARIYGPGRSGIDHGLWVVAPVFFRRDTERARTNHGYAGIYRARTLRGASGVAGERYLRLRCDSA